MHIAIGSYNGILAQFFCSRLGGLVIQEAIKRANVDIAQVDEVIMGNVFQAGRSKSCLRSNS